MGPGCWEGKYLGKDTGGEMHRDTDMGGEIHRERDTGGEIHRDTDTGGEIHRDRGAPSGEAAGPGCLGCVRSGCGWWRRGPGAVPAPCLPPSLTHRGPASSRRRARARAAWLRHAPPTGPPRAPHWRMSYRAPFYWSALPSITREPEQAARCHGGVRCQIVILSISPRCVPSSLPAKLWFYPGPPPGRFWACAVHCGGRGASSRRHDGE